MKVQLINVFNDVVSLDNLLAAWSYFLKGKASKSDVQVFRRYLIDNLLDLHNDLILQRYKHGGYKEFVVADPKPRRIHKACVRDRVLHHAIYRVLNQWFDKTFVLDSYSCRDNKGTHRAIKKFRIIAQRASGNFKRTCWVLQCDIRKFFDNIDHSVLKFVLEQYIPDAKLMWLLDELISSFTSGHSGKGLPLGNLTSQLLVNIYMNEFDQYVKHRLKAKYYIRYADDFVFLSADRTWLAALVPKIQGFLNNVLQLALHEDKIIIRTVASGVDFIGWVNFSDHRVLRTLTKKRMLRRIRERPQEATLQSYLGLMRHGQTEQLCKQVITEQWLWR